MLTQETPRLPLLDYRKTPPGWIPVVAQIPGGPMLTKENDLAAAAAAYQKAQAAMRALQDGEGSVDAWVSAVNAHDAASANLRRVAALPPEHRTRSADIYDPLTGLFTPTQVAETLRLAPRERIPGDRIVISVAEFDRLQALEVDSHLSDAEHESIGEPDQAEHDRVAAALDEGGTIAGGAAVLGVSRRRMKVLIIQHRVQWPKVSIGEHIENLRKAVKP